MVILFLFAPMHDMLEIFSCFERPPIFLFLFLFFLFFSFPLFLSFLFLLFSRKVNWTFASPSSGFSGLTGSVAATDAGVFAFWPAGDQSGILSAAATDAPTLNSWRQRGQVIARPAYVPSNDFRDPLRAINVAGNWYVGVGCSQNGHAALCLFRASNSSLASFTVKKKKKE